MRPQRFLLAALALVLAALAPAQQRLTPAKDANESLQSQGAARLNLSLQRFRELANRQPSLHVSARGNLVYKCARPRRAPVSARIVGDDNSTFLSPPAQPLTQAQVLSLHSRPGATRVIYLDFNGHTITDSDWNEGLDPSIQVAPFDIDGVPGRFSAAELVIIQQIWRRVAEDYAPFDVDITTEDPGINGIISGDGVDPRFGVRALIGDDATYIGEADPVGLLGLALLGTYGGARDNPALVFSVAHGTDYALIADTISHEVGHTLGLEHHGSDIGGVVEEYYAGHGIWAPIMGSGPSNAVSQWSRGEYANANNPDQDDIAVISTFIPVATSDHPSDKAAADAAAIVLPGDTLMGTLRSAGDTAWYRFAAMPGVATFTGSVSSLGPNLKVGLSVIDAAGNVLGSSTPNLRPLSASLTVTLPAYGEYYLEVDGVGYLDADTGFTDYGSLGRYSVSGNWTVNRAPLASTGGSTPLMGRRPLRVNLDGRGSIDGDGAIASYVWTFSDGTPSINASTATVNFATAGTRTATLTVTDDIGATHSTSIVVTATEGTSFARPMSIVAGSTSWVASSRNSGRATATFRVADSAGRPLPGVTVTASVSGLRDAYVSAVSDRAGNATLSTAEIPAASRGSVSFTVRSATLAPYEYLGPSRDKVRYPVTLRR